MANTAPNGAQTKLLSAARDLFARDGYRSTSVDAVAEAAGVSRSLVFWHFKSKEGLVWAVITDTASRWIDAVRQASAGLRGAAALQAALSRRQRFMLEEGPAVRLYYLMVGEAIGADPELAGTVVALYDQMRRSIRAWIAEAMADGEIAAPLEADAVAEVFMAALDGVGQRWILGGPSFDLAAADSAVVTLVLGLPMHDA